MIGVVAKVLVWVPAEHVIMVDWEKVRRWSILSKTVCAKKQVFGWQEPMASKFFCDSELVQESPMTKLWPRCLRMKRMIRALRTPSVLRFIWGWCGPGCRDAEQPRNHFGYTCRLVVFQKGVGPREILLEDREDVAGTLAVGVFSRLSVRVCCLLLRNASRGQTNFELNCDQSCPAKISQRQGALQVLGLVSQTPVPPTLLFHSMASLRRQACRRSSLSMTSGP